MMDTDLEWRMADLGSEISPVQVRTGPSCTIPLSVGLDPAYCRTQPHPHPPEICFESRREWSQDCKSLFLVSAVLSTAGMF